MSLALIQKNLLSMFPEQGGTVDAFFNGGMRQVSIRATTSCVFRYAPPTRPINLFLLAEEDRKKILDMEVTARTELARNVQQQMERRKQQVTDQVAAIPALNDSEQLEVQLGNEAELGLLSDMEEGEADGINFTSNGNLPISADGSVNKNFAFGANLGGMGGGMGGGGSAFQKMQQDANRIHAKNGLGKDKKLGIGQASGAGSKLRNLASFNLEIRQTQDVNSDELDFDFAPYAGVTGTAPFDGSANALRDHWADVNNLRMYFRSDKAQMQRGLVLLSDAAEGTILGLNGRGEYQVVNGLSVAALQAVAKDGLEILPGMGSAETGYWNPRIVTDKDGKATLTLRLPDRSTAWKLLSRGINREALAGEAEVEIVSKKDLFGEMKAPLAFTIGDKADILVEIHNSTLKEGSIDVKFKSTIGDKTTDVKKTIAVKKIGIEELSFPVEISAGETAEFELSVSSGDLKDVSARSAVLIPYGTPVFATASGTSAQNTSVIIQHAAGLAVENPQLELLIGPSVNRTLLDAVLGGGVSLYDRAPASPASLSSDIERAISDAIGGVALLKMIEASRTAETPEAQALAGKITSAISLLVSSQRDDGGWSWGGRPVSERPDRYMSSRAVWALAAARSAGFAVPQPIFDKGVQHLNTVFSAAGESDNEGKAIILHGMAEAGAADFAFANRLHRNRNALSASGLVHLALVFAKLDRKDFANGDTPGPGEDEDLDGSPAARDKVEADEAARRVHPLDAVEEVELRALYLLCRCQRHRGRPRERSMRSSPTGSWRPASARDGAPKRPTERRSPRWPTGLDAPSSPMKSTRSRSSPTTGRSRS